LRKLVHIWTACVFAIRAPPTVRRQVGSLLPSAIVNGVVAVPIMVVMMMLAVKPGVMGPFVVKRRLLALGWVSTAVMAAAVVAMFATM
jgi:Mn2+/Fe2+ NRAMP family transporter